MAKKLGTVTMSAPGKKPIKFKKGALHRQLGVPEGEPIPAGKKQAALSGKLGSLAKKRANFAFKGALAAGRQTRSMQSPEGIQGAKMKRYSGRHTKG
jgi:hypothetical protein